MSNLPIAVSLINIKNVIIKKLITSVCGIHNSFNL